MKFIIESFKAWRQKPLNESGFKHNSIKTMFYLFSELSVQILKDVNWQIIWKECIKILQKIVENKVRLHNCFRYLSVDHSSFYIILITISFHVPNKSTWQPIHQMWSVWMGWGCGDFIKIVLGNCCRNCIKTPHGKNRAWSNPSTSRSFSG